MDVFVTEEQRRFLESFTFITTWAVFDEHAINILYNKTNSHMLWWRFWKKKSNHRLSTFYCYLLGPRLAFQQCIWKAAKLGQSAAAEADSPPVVRRGHKYPPGPRPVWPARIMCTKTSIRETRQNPHTFCIRSKF